MRAVAVRVSRTVVSTSDPLPVGSMLQSGGVCGVPESAPGEGFSDCRPLRLYSTMSAGIPRAGRKECVDDYVVIA